MRDFLLTGMDYDLWANRTWSGFIQRMPDPEPVFAVLTHIIRGSRAWLDRVGSLHTPTAEGLESAFAANHGAWRQVVHDRNLDEIIAYENSRGIAYERPLGEIAWHVVNHGTYHRGQIRMIAENQGVKDWPETDLIGFFNELRGVD